MGFRGILKLQIRIIAFFKVSTEHLIIQNQLKIILEYHFLNNIY